MENLIAPKVIVKISGGLGNQLFQYYAGKNFSEQVGGRMVLDLDFFTSPPKGATPRDFKLDKIEGLIFDVEKSKFYCKSKILKALGWAYSPFGIRVVVEDNWDQAISEKKDIFVLNGYWQDTKFITSNQKEKKKTLDLTMEQRSGCEDYLAMVDEGVGSLHIRRGDYVTSASTAKVHGICSMDYYAKAIALAHKQGVEKLLIFTDDKNWVENNFKSNIPFVVVNIGGDDADITEMLLMSKYRFNIIANSTFSWWAAWLNDSPNKAVVSPEKWYEAAGRNTNLKVNGWINIS